ncbi:glutamine synthetase guanido kinase [Collybia nuda]|uniref:Glutamine synthetase n=1 Tax=Collybia nuda TaxID=64659 RepID=A0A9P5Y7C1_9AGAR|nr:glutamine synthetase guanido kinase [Collybia nuda]
MPQDNSYAIPYSPSSLYSPRTSTGKLTSVQKLLNHGIRYIRVQLVDPTNNVRYRVIPISQFERMFEGPRPSITIFKGVLGMAFLGLAPGFIPDGEYLYVPDLSTLKYLPYKNAHASVLGWFQEKIPYRGADEQLTTKVESCPRTLLQSVVERAKETSGVEFLVGFETEFILLNSTDPITAIHHNHAYSNSLALPTGSVAEIVLEEIADMLQLSGVELLMYHPEASYGQYEIVTGPLPPLKAVDALVHTRETIYNIASKHGLRATLAPRVFKNSCGSATHAHISVHSTKPSLSCPSPNEPNLTEAQASFLSGLLAELPAVSALTLPLPASYSRVVDGVWSGGTYVCWGSENREVPIRLCNPTEPASRNFEFKMLDGTANPYYALAAILGAGSAGVKEERPLQMKDCSGLSAAERGEEGRKALGITQRMPLNWEEARKSLRESDVVKAALGEEVVDAYLRVNQFMAKSLDAPYDEHAKMKLLVENY